MRAYADVAEDSACDKVFGLLEQLPEMEAAAANAACGRPGASQWRRLATTLRAAADQADEVAERMEQH